MCMMSRRITAEKSKMTPETLEIVKDLWNHWEHTSMELGWANKKLEDWRQDAIQHLQPNFTAENLDSQSS